MQLGGRRPPPADDVAQALRVAARELGHRPAVTVLHPDRREEQGFVSLAQWAAKGAHFLEVELALAPGDRLTVVGPAGWLPVAAALAAWWSAIVVTDGPADVALVHETALAPTAVDDVLWWGDAADGTPTGPVPGEPWALAVQTFPDQPPPTRATRTAAATVAGDTTTSHADLLAAAGAIASGGPLGVEGQVGLQHWSAAVVRPLVTGTATVLLRDADRSVATADGVASWLVPSGAD